jgi:hypothetical protein
MIGLLGGTAAVSGATAARPHKPKPKPACDARARGASLVTKQVIVFRRHIGTAPSGEPSTTYLACARPRGASVALGYSWPDDGEYGSDATLDHFRSAGTYVTAQGSSGEASLSVCSKYAQPNCPMAHYFISVVDARSRRHVDLSIPGYSSASATAVSGAGAVAWLEYAGTTGYALKATTLRPRGRSGFETNPQPIDSGQIVQGSVRFDGRTLRWIRDGIARSQTLS